MPRKLSLQEIQARIKLIHGDLIKILPETYIAYDKPATFLDKEFGPWRTRVRRVLDGTVCRKRAKRLTIDQVQDKLRDMYKGNVFIVPESYKKVGSKALFFDTEGREWEAFVSNVLAGHLGSFAHVRHVHPETGKPLIDLWRQHGGNIITMQKIVAKYGVETALRYLDDNLDENGQYIKKVSSLEIKFQDLFSNTGISVEFWNKEVPEVKIHSDKVYRPDFKLSYNDQIVYVDVHGLYMHSELKQKKLYHVLRRQAFERAGIRYIQFFEDEIRDNGLIVKSLILNQFGLIPIKYFARKLMLKPVDRITARDFFTKNHLMGPHLTSRSVGLYDGNILITCLAYRNSFHHGMIEISRFATKLDTSCVGGFGKLVSFLKQFNKPIVSYCDLRYATGNSYQKLGFTEIKTTLGWQWTDSVYRFNRTECKAGKGFTERENASQRKWYKIYDAGQCRYQLI